MKIKPCKCGNIALNNRRICYQCFLKRERSKRELKIAKLKNRKKIKKEKIRNSYRYLHKVADKLFSQYVRMKGCDKNGFDNCYTCGIRLHWKKMNAGHFHHGKLDFDERNRRKQCPQCNTWKSGNLGIFGTKLAEELGVQGMIQLMIDAHQRVYSTPELKQIILTYQSKLKELQK